MSQPVTTSNEETMQRSTGPLKFFALADMPPSGRAPVSTCISIVDLAVYAFIVSIGVFQLTHYLHTTDFPYDATYPDLARSLLETGSYQIRFLPETTLPPGFSIILAIVGKFFGFAPKALFPVVSVSASLALIAAYELLRRVEGRAVAAGACLLLASSPAFFTWATTFVYPEMTYFLVSMIALLLALRIDRTEAERAPIGWILLLSFALSLAVMVRSVGVALLAALVAWIAASFLFFPEAARRRLLRFSIPLILGLSVQLGWSTWAQRHETLEWQLPGYPQSYFSQLRVKDGHYPELGMANLSDVPKRIERNIVTRTAGLVALVSQRYIARFWSSPAVIGVLLVLVWGLASSLRQGGQLYDWYFLCHECIFALWPWDYNDRFLIPVFPLACLYLWRGVKELKNYSAKKPKVVGLSLVLLGFSLSLASAAFAGGMLTFTTDVEHRRGDHLQPVAAILCWILVMAIGFVMLRFHSFRQAPDDASALARLSRVVQTNAPLLLQLIAITAVAVLLIKGTARVVAASRENLTSDVTQLSGYPMIEAAEWIQQNEPPDRVVMARDSEFIFHYVRRRVVWFPPISDPKVLMDGIRRYHVGVILVVHHADNYWLPAEDSCFQSLLRTYGSAFRLTHQGIDSWVYEVTPPPPGS